MEFTPWTVFTDLGLVLALLLFGKLLRAKVRLVQRLFIPASILAGLLGLLLGPNGVGFLPFSENIGTYPSVLIALIFAAIPLGQTINLRQLARRAGTLWSYTQAMRILQWGLGLLVGLLVLKSIFNVPDGFGLLLAAGFVGGHGTVAAVGTAFEGLGWEEATSLGFTSATVGVVAAILGGLALIKWGTRTQRTTVLTDFADLPEELRTGLIPRQRREPTGQGTISSNSLEPLAFHLGLIFLSALVAYYLSELAERVNPQISVPVFGVAFLVGLIVQGLLVLTGGVSYVDRGTVTGVTGTATDLLVAFSIASIVPSVVADNALPLTILLVFGLFYCLLLFRYLAPIMFSEYAFEKGIFDWGWSTGTVAMGIALLRIVDPNLESETLEEYGIAYIPIAPVDVLVTTFAPFLVAFGFAWAFVGASLALGAGVLILAWFLGWWAISPKRPQSS